MTSTQTIYCTVEASVIVIPPFARDSISFRMLVEFALVELARECGEGAQDSFFLDDVLGRARYHESFEVQLSLRQSMCFNRF
jgi:hypothetical protein